MIFLVKHLDLDSNLYNLKSGIDFSRVDLPRKQKKMYILKIIQIDQCGIF